MTIRNSDVKTIDSNRDYNIWEMLGNPPEVLDVKDDNGETVRLTGRSVVTYLEAEADKARAKAFAEFCQDLTEDDVEAMNAAWALASDSSGFHPDKFWAELKDRHFADTAKALHSFGFFDRRATADPFADQMGSRWLSIQRRIVNGALKVYGSSSVKKAKREEVETSYAKDGLSLKKATSADNSLSGFAQRTAHILTQITTK